jgi:SAM-dependent methyltransferase
MKNINLRETYDHVFANGSKNFFSVNYFDEAYNIVGMGNWENKDVLDIGCGEGILCAMIAHAGASSVTGIDYSSEAITNATTKFNIDNLNFIAGDYKTITNDFDVITMEGVMEHFDSPWQELESIMDNYVRPGGSIITSSPSFLNPRGYVWMTLLKLFDVPMSLTDLHYICPFDMKKFCEKKGFKLEYKSIYQDWGSGERMIYDFNKRLRNALRDADMDNSKVDDLLAWLSKAKDYFTQDNHSGAVVVYEITR